MKTLRGGRAAPSYRPSRPMRLLLALGSRLAIGEITVILPDGSQRSFAGAEQGPSAFLQIHRDRLARRALTGGTLGFCEAYLDGDWSSPDVETLFIFFLMNQERLHREMQGKAWYRALNYVRHIGRHNDRSGARRNIHAHYDLGNGFYEAWLDPTMTYSSALFTDGAADLEAAQRRKYAALADRIALTPDQSVLEIGCGWGGFAAYAAGERGAKVTGITISKAQHDYACRRVFEAGLAERVDIRLQDYRDVEGSYDTVASIEMFEAVGEKYWPTYFQTVRDRLKPGGYAGLQIITIADRFYESYRRKADYIQRYIFPGGMLPSPRVLRDQMTRVGLTISETIGFGPDYARTLRGWNQRFQDAWPHLRPLGFDARFKRLWEQYLHYCAAGFEVGTIDVVQVAAKRS